jgi:hypothetical protein
MKKILYAGVILIGLFGFANGLNILIHDIQSGIISLHIFVEKETAIIVLQILFQFMLNFLMSGLMIWWGIKRLKNSHLENKTISEH